MNRFACVAFAVYVIAYFFEAPLRYSLFKYGIEQTIYIRDGVLVLIIFVSLPRHVTPKVDPLFLLVAYALVCHLLVGFFYLPYPMQALFGMKLYLPILLGIVIYPLLRDRHRTVTGFALVLFLATVGGVFGDYYVRYPWEGFTYLFDGTEIPGSYVWWQYGRPRLAGFTRASFDAAINTLAVALIVVIRTRNWALRFAVWITAGLAIALTTSKGVVLAHVVITVVFALEMAGLRRWRFLQRSLIPITALIVIAPLASVALSLLHVRFDRTGWINTRYLSSYFERLEDMWPRAFSLVAEHGDYLFGRGLGGIGTPQILYEPLLHNAADNIFVMMYATFGLASLLYLGYFVGKALLLDLSKETDLLFGTYVVFTLVYGLTTGVFDNAIMGVLIGSALGHLSKQATAGVEAGSAANRSAAQTQAQALYRQPRGSME